MLSGVLADVIKAVDNNTVILLYLYRDYFAPFDYVNKAIEEKSGYSREELLTKVTPSDLVHPSVREEIYKNFQRRIRGEKLPVSYEMPVIDRWGNTKWIYVSFSVVEYKGGLAILGIGTEVTERKEAEDLLKTIVDILPYGLVVIDKDFNVIFCNRQSIRWMKNKNLGYPYGMKCYEAFHGREKPFDDCVAFQAFRNGVPHVHEVRRESKRGERWFEISAYPVKELNNEIKKVVVYARDITETKKLKEEEIKVQKLESLALLAGGIAHDFNNILTGIMGNISLALSACSDSEVRKFLKEAEKNCLYAKKLTYSLLTFSKEEKPRVKPERVGEIVTEALNLISVPSRIKVVKDFPEDLKSVLVDKEQMVRVLQNILINAVEAIDGIGEIEIKAENTSLENGDFVRIIIKDTGKGIPKDVLPKIFDIFYSTKSKGTGLGLAVAYSIVKKHGGKIEVSSEEGKGTTFTIILPASSAIERRKIGGKGLEGLKILIMDDNHGIVNMLSLYFKKQKAIVYTAYKGEEVLKILESIERKGEHIDVFIFDIVVPDGMGGLELLKAIKGEYRDACFIAISGYYEFSKQGELEKAGFDAFVRKPFSLDYLRKTIIEACKKEGLK